jgi:hypothetical protein
MVLALRVPRRFLTIFIALLIAAPSLWAQSNYGAIGGIISTSPAELRCTRATRSRWSASFPSTSRLRSAM